MKIFGRDPAAVVGVLEAGLSFILILAHVSADTIGITIAVVASLFGIYTAWVTHDTLLSAVIGFTKAVLALAVVFGFSLTPDASGALIAFITVALGLFNHSQNSFADTPSFSQPKVVTLTGQVGTFTGNPTDQPS